MTAGRAPRGPEAAGSGAPTCMAGSKSPRLRARLAAAAGFAAYRAHAVPWAEQRRSLYAQMADHVAAHVELDPVRRYLGI